jgi:hypothetical protein
LNGRLIFLTGAGFGVYLIKNKQSTRADISGRRFSGAARGSI